MRVIDPNIGNLTAHVNGYLTDCGSSPSRSYYRAMLSDILDRIERRLGALGISASAASKQAGLSVDAIRNMRRAAELDDRQGVSTSTLQALAPVLKTSASWLLEGIGPEDASERLVPIIGYVGADNEGTVFFTMGQGTDELVPMQPGGKAAAQALHVRGHSMKGVAENGALIFFEEQRSRPSPDMLGQVVVVETADGRVLVKRLLKGSHSRVFDLESIVGPTMSDVELRWAAHISAIVPPAKARQIIIRAGDNQAA